MVLKLRGDKVEKYLIWRVEIDLIHSHINTSDNDMKR